VEAVTGFWVGLLVGGTVFGYIGLKAGGLVLLARMSRVDHADRRRKYWSS
jgi:hypothetical protein